MRRAVPGPTPLIRLTDHPARERAHQGSDVARIDGMTSTLVNDPNGETDRRGVRRPHVAPRSARAMFISALSARRGSSVAANRLANGAPSGRYPSWRSPGERFPAHAIRRRWSRRPYRVRCGRNEHCACTGPPHHEIQGLRAVPARTGPPHRPIQGLRAVPARADPAGLPEARRAEVAIARSIPRRSSRSCR